MKKIAYAAVAVLVLAACTQKQPTTDLTTTSAAPEITPVETVPSPTAMAPMTFKLTALNNSKQDGTATLEDIGAGVKVTLTLANGVTTPEPAHIHVGSCPSPGEVKYPLNNVVSGKSETTLADVTMASLESLGALSINVHKSAADLKTYMACGDLNWSGSSTGTMDHGSMMMASPSTY